MGVTTVFPRPSRPIKGGSRNSGAAKGSPALERDRHEAGARSLARGGFSRVLPGLKDVPGEAAAGACGPGGRGGRSGISRISRPGAAGGRRGPAGLAAEVRRAPLSPEPAGPGVGASLPAAGGRGAPPARTRPFPPPGPPAPGPLGPRRRRPTRGCPSRRGPPPAPTRGVSRCPLF